MQSTVKPTYLYTPEERSEIQRQYRDAKGTIGLMLDQVVADITLSDTRSHQAAIVYGAYRLLPDNDTSMSTEQQLYFVTAVQRWMKGQGYRA